MKKVLLIIFMSVILCASSFMLYTKYNEYNKTKDEVKKLESEISKVKQDIEVTEQNKVDAETKITELKEEKKAELKELDVWKKMQEKLNQALS